MTTANRDRWKLTIAVGICSPDVARHDDGAVRGFLAAAR